MTLTPAELSTAWQLQSLLLGYPEDGFAGRIHLVRGAAGAIPVTVREPLLAFAEHAEARPLAELAAEYVETFDHRRRCCLYLTYYAHGDTRQRGVALLKLKQRYARAGLVLTDEELPDHLAVLLEFAAAGNVTAGQKLLAEHRAGVELLRLALTDQASPWRYVLDSVCATLPPLRGDEREAVARLAAEGPPEEEVGLAPFAPPEYMPQTIGSRP
jgi:nitrate reductase molybdenum cofactor assembly chaperone NarJ/NarW